MRQLVEVSPSRFGGTYRQPADSVLLNAETRRGVLYLQFGVECGGQCSHIKDDGERCGNDALDEETAFCHVHSHA